MDDTAPTHLRISVHDRCGDEVMECMGHKQLVIDV